MRKLLSAITAFSMLAASFALPASANYTASDYDIVDQNLTFDDGTVTNTIDNTPAYQTGTTTETLMTTSLDTTKEFYLAFDFRFDTESGYIETPRNDSSGTVGLTISLSDGQLRTQTGSSSYQKLGAFSVGSWYTAEVEGKTGCGSQYTTFRLYSYDEDGTKTLVQETPSLNMRNISSNSRSFNYVKGHDISIDNVKLIAEKPDTISITSTADEINAGAAAKFSYTMLRQNVEFTSYAVEWSVYDETNTEQLTDDSVTIGSDGTLSASIDAPTETVTVRATATDDFANGTLIGTKQLKINAVDTDNEKFDTIIISGSQSVKAGTSSVYTYTASKGGTDVTDTLTSDDVVWSIYNTDDLTPNGSSEFTIDNGTLTISDTALAQTIYVRASTSSGAVFGSLAVSVEWSDSQTEEIVYSNPCEEAVDYADRVTSNDGSTAYLVNTATKLYFNNTDYADCMVTDMDVKFSANGAGFVIFRKDGTENSSFYYNDGVIRQQTGGSKYSTIMSGASTDTWYHVELLYSGGGAYAAINIYQYGDDGSKTLATSVESLNTRNTKNYGALNLCAGTYVDNIKVAKALPNSISLSAPSKYISAGETAQFSASVERNGLTMSDYSDYSWYVSDSEGQLIKDDSVTIANGLLTTEATATPQTVTVIVKTANALQASASITIQSSEIFTITNIGVNEEGTKIVRLYFDKNYYYSDDVAFMVGVYNPDGVLKGFASKSGYGDEYNVGSNEITLNCTLPDDFDSETWSISGFAWTTMY